MNMNELPIGVFDSGMGGLTAVSELMKILPNEDIIYLGDTARVPYGTKSRETILRYAGQDFGFLKALGVKYIVAACGTVSSVMASEPGFGGSDCTDVILPAAEAACAATRSKRIGVIATSASIRSGSYEKAIKKILPDSEVFSKACPMFVPLVENGYTSEDCAPALSFAEEYIGPLIKENIDVLLLGCTHYPLLSGLIKRVTGSGVTLISSGAEAARHAKQHLMSHNLLNKKDAPGNVRFYCTDSPELFRENAGNFIDLKGITVERCSVE